MAEKTLYFLIGPKGAGKTYIGTRVDRATEISFIRVEQLAPRDRRLENR
jgi:shikimate kinase